MSAKKSTSDALEILDMITGDDPKIRALIKAEGRKLAATSKRLKAKKSKQGKMSTEEFLFRFISGGLERVFDGDAKKCLAVVRGLERRLEEAKAVENPITWRGRDLGSADAIMYYRGRLHIDSIRGAAYLSDLPGSPLLAEVLRSDDYEVEIRVLRSLVR